jgi:hypothetical protein
MGKDIMTIEEFKECCESSCFTDYGGYGYFCDQDGSNKEGEMIYPSAFLAKDYETQKTHIIWFNR